MTCLTYGFNVYVMIDLFMKYSKCSHRMTWHIYAFIWEEKGAPFQQLRKFIQVLKKRPAEFTEAVINKWGWMFSEG